MNKDFPTSDMELTHILVVSNMEQSRHFYGDVLGATVVREYGGTSCVLKFQGSWLLLVTGGEPTRPRATAPGGGSSTGPCKRPSLSDVKPAGALDDAGV